MGGRGASGGYVGGGGYTAVTKAQAAKMSRGQLERLATRIYAKNAVSQGLSRAEGVRRATALMDGNTTAQLRKYVVRNSRPR